MLAQKQRVTCDGILIEVDMVPGADFPMAVGYDSGTRLALLWQILSDAEWRASKRLSTEAACNAAQTLSATGHRRACECSLQ